MRLSAAILFVALSTTAKGQDLGGHALFVRTPDADSGKKNAKGLCEPLHLPLAKEKEKKWGRRCNAMMYT